ncbi:YbgA family protein [Legionella cardiaca]|uniref:DUF523 and DUF1722 domain-containing protein n=1 Tax=Legionella cardiaca TaxID=1071983 RepID=A0ABY8AR81_9GAMM|nr:DUF523 and DUF1722 domain-containing protein [Legionella cardiaca]WED42731.1 DUF523 and DUF1722 domain-containing protein [Legionella cardiaca]
MNKSIIIGISHCLLGMPVRFNGGHKKDDYITDVLAHYFDFYPICPEVESGMGVPRPALHLEGDPKYPRLVEALNPQIDHTAKLQQFCQNRIKDLQHLSGFILKNKSPSCGWKNVKIYQSAPLPPKIGQGIFANFLEKYYPFLPIEEEGRLRDFRLRENFIERVFCYRRFQELTKNNLNKQSIVAFHTEHKLTLLAHNETIYRELGKKVADLKHIATEQFAHEYLALFMEGMKKIATLKTHSNVLQHIQGYFKEKIDAGDKAELHETIMAYQSGKVPLIVPVILIKHHLRRHPESYLLKQRYLFPYPEEMMLRNHI